LFYGETAAHLLGRVPRNRLLPHALGCFAGPDPMLIKLLAGAEHD
jgi:hypothetical protein